MNQGTSVTRAAVLRGCAAAIALAIVGLVTSTPPAFAYDRYSQNRDATNCRACHGDFRAGIYISPTDGQNWGNLHNLHRQTMLNGDCSTCHSGGTFPVILHQSDGGDGLDPISCVGCHGRAEDNVPENPEVADGGSGYGAGLRQHHFSAGETVCANCHLDANPANYAAVGEDTLPVYYANPGNGHPAMPTDPCNADGSEDFAGDPEGLDNDGDDLYDGDDTDCSGAGSVEPGVLAATGAVLLPNYPNPFLDQTILEYELATPGRIEIRILDVHGRLVRTIHSSASEPGRHQASWDGRDEAGHEMPSGVYLCELRSAAARSQRAMVLIR